MVVFYKSNYLGQKVEKTVRDNATITTTNYLGHYENNDLKFFATAEGYVNVIIMSIGTQKFTNFNYVYNYTDHLGNIRLSYTNNSVNGITILEENHYYPFGLKHKKYGSVDKDLVCVNEDCYEIGIDVVPPQARKTYQYKYNGKEFQDELGLNFHDYGARNYDPAIGRWMNIDPLAEQGRRWSPYTYAMDNPVYFIDPDGMWVSNGGGREIINYQEKGNVAMTSTHTFKGHSRLNDRGINGSRWFFGGEILSTVHSHILPTSGTNSSGSRSELSKSTSGFSILGTQTTNSVTLTNTKIAGNYYNSSGELVDSINNASTFIVTNTETSLTVNVYLNSVSDTVNVNINTTTTTYDVTGGSQMKQYGGLQLANPQTTPTNSTSSTMELSSTPESLQTTANSEMQKNSGITLPNPASDHIESTTQRTFEQELFYNDHPVNNTRN